MCDLQHHFGKGFSTTNKWRTFFAQSGQRDTSEQCEHQNLQNVVRRHRFERIFWENRQDEIPEVELLDLANRGGGIGDGIYRCANAWLEHEEKPDDWTAAVETMDRLIWSTQPKTSSEDRRQLVDVLPELIRKLKARGVAVILISHRMPDVFEVCDRVQLNTHGESATWDADKMAAMKI